MLSEHLLYSSIVNLGKDNFKGLRNLSAGQHIND